MFVFLLLVTMGRSGDVQADLSLEYVRVMKEKIKKQDFLEANHLDSTVAYKRMQIKHDLEGYPEYVTNGEGPQYSKEQVEQMKREGKFVEPDFMPNMPDKMPDILLE